VLDRGGHLPIQIKEITEKSGWCTPEFFNCCFWGQFGFGILVPEHAKYYFKHSAQGRTATLLLRNTLTSESPSRSHSAIREHSDLVLQFIKAKRKSTSPQSVFSIMFQQF